MKQNKYYTWSLPYILTALLWQISMILQQDLFAAEPPASTRKVIILHTNDQHFNRIPHFNALQTVVSQFRNQYSDVLLFDAGDFLIREERWTERSIVTDLEGYIEYATHMISCMNALGYDAVTPGNHELDYHTTVTKSLLATLNAPLLGANVTVTTSDFTQLTPYIHHQTTHGIHLTILGLCIGGYAYGTGGIAVSSPVAASNNYTNLKDQCDALILLSHIGVVNDRKIAERHGGEVFDVIVGGHSHTLLNPPELNNGVLLAQTGGGYTKNQYLGVVSLAFDENNLLIDKQGEVLVFTGSNIPQSRFLKRETEMAETFEGYIEGYDLNAIPGWRGTAMVTAKTYSPPLPPGYPKPEAEHTRVLSLMGQIEKTVMSDSGLTVNIDTMMQAERYNTELAALSATTQTAFAIDSNGFLNAWHYCNDPEQGWQQRWTVIWSEELGENEWFRLSVTMDYDTNASGDSLFCPRFNGSLCPTPYGFKSPHNMQPGGPWYVCANSPGRGESGNSFVSTLIMDGNGAIDDFVVTQRSFAHSGSTTTNDIPFKWFDQWGIARLPDNDSDGDGISDASEYITGTDPTDPLSIFVVVDTWIANNRVYVAFTGNDTGAATPYIMERTDDLVTGVWEVVDDNIPRITAPDTVNLWSEQVPADGTRFYYRPKAKLQHTPGN